MADAIYPAPVDPIVGINISSVRINMRPRMCILTVQQVHESGNESAESTIVLEGERATAWMQAWMQAAPVRKMVRNLIDGGELSGVTET